MKLGNLCGEGLLGMVDIVLHRISWVVGGTVGFDGIYDNELNAATSLQGRLAVHTFLISINDLSWLVYIALRGIGGC